MEAFKGYRTLALVTVMLILQLWQGTAPANTVPKDWMPFVDGLFAIAFGVLRMLTNTPIGKSAPAPALGADEIRALMEQQMAEFLQTIETNFEPKLVAAHAPPAAPIGGMR